ncbi:MAG: lasso peptide biosynthesis PqqD family chaperone [bacterium]|nr:lasso peptide biosynthesis PqqD family chaperone [bacterium]
MDATIARNSEIISSNMDDETVMMSVEQGEYYGVSPVGSRIWELLETPKIVADICAALRVEYDVTEEQCHGDVQMFLNHMAKKKIITISKKDKSD